MVIRSWIYLDTPLVQSVREYFIFRFIELIMYLIYHQQKKIMNLKKYPSLIFRTEGSNFSIHPKKCGPH